MKKNYSLFLFLLLSPVVSFSQNTYDMVYNLFQTNCNNAGCHNSTDKAAGLDLGASSASVYSNLFNNPTNTAALAKGDKLVMAGYPHRSFLMRKCNTGLDSDNGIGTGEGNDMSYNLKLREKELIRQWILGGAPMTGQVADTAVINKYYSGKGINSFPVAPPLPTAVGSFQIHLGKIFIAPNSEAEYFIKHKITLPDTVKVHRIDLKMAKQAHHFLIYKFFPGQDASFSDGLRLLNTTNGQGSSSGKVSLVSAFQYSHDDSLPPNTAYLWEKDCVLDLNYHCHNASVDSVLGIDVYIDVYTQPKTTTAAIMYSEIIQNFFFNIPKNINYTYTSPFSDIGATNYWKVWQLTSHTHKYGKDFDIFLRNPNGSQGAQIYEGFYNADYTFNQGYYDWAHPPLEDFYDLTGNFLTMNPKDGFVYKATWFNYGNTNVGFGYTTDDEMMLFYVSYILGNPITGVKEAYETKNAFRVSPNPLTDIATLSYSLQESGTVQMELYNVLGSKLAVLCEQEQAPGNYNYVLNPAEHAMPAGVYFVKLSVNGESSLLKVVKN